MKSRFRIAGDHDELTEDFGRACEIASRNIRYGVDRAARHVGQNLSIWTSRAKNSHVDGENERAMIKDMANRRGMLNPPARKTSKRMPILSAALGP